MYNHIKTIYLYAITLALISCAKTQEPSGETLVARVENRDIRLAAISANVEGGAKINGGLAVQKQNLRKEIKRIMKVLEARRRGLDKNEHMQEARETKQREAAIYRMIEAEIIDRIVSPEDIEDYKKYAGVRVRARHILLRMPTDASEAQERAIRYRIENLYLQVTSGKNFSEIAMESSEDMKTKDKGGNLGQVSWASTRYPLQIKKMAFSMKPGEVSRPFKTKEGYHILKLDDRRLIPNRKTLKDDTRIKEFIARTRGEEVRRMYMEMVEDEFARYSVELDTTLMAEIIQLLSPAPGDTSGRRPNPTEALRAVDGSRALASYFGGGVTVGEWRGHLLQSPPRSIESFKNGVKRTVVRELLEVRARSRGYFSDPAVVRRVRSSMDGILVKEMERKEIATKLVVTDEAAKEYYEAHQQEYMFPAKREVREIRVKDYKLAHSLYKRAQNGENFARLAKRYTQRTGFKEKGGRLGFIGANQFGIVGKVAHQLKVGSISSPQREGNFYSIIKVLNHKEPEQKTFDQAKPQVKATIRRAQERELRRKLEEELKARYSYVIYHPAFADVEI